MDFLSSAALFVMNPCLFGLLGDAKFSFIRETRWVQTETEVKPTDNQRNDH